VTDDADTAQARELLQSLHAHVDEISKKVESAERRTRRVQGHAAVVARRRVASLRHELYEAHGLIDRLHRRFPETRPERLRSGGCTDRRPIDR
jgi:predicted RNase H-like nuclease (RuvC/YqgF family)